MNRILTFLLFLTIVLGVYGRRALNRLTPYDKIARSASASLFLEGDGGRRFICSGTEIDSYKQDGILLTARHCVVDTDTNEVRKHFAVTFSDNELGPYYEAVPMAISQTDDLAILFVNNGASLPEVRVGDENLLANGNMLFNVSYPLDSGKQEFHGAFLAPTFNHVPSALIEELPMWKFAMPFDMTIAHGSSGSGIFSSRQQALVGVAVGTTGEAGFSVAIPASRVRNLLMHLSDNTVADFVKKNKIKLDTSLF